MRVLIIIPAFNEADNIEQVINSLGSENSHWDILVVNDCSIDSTGQIAEATGKTEVINLTCNLGIGGAVQTGFKFAVKYNYDFAVQFDGDGQHRAGEIKKILDPLYSKTADVVIGSRFLEKHTGWKSSYTRRVGIFLFKVINSILINQKITDNTSGFRAYNKKAIRFLAVYYPIDYPEPEAVILLGKNGFKIVERSTKMQERTGGKSSITGFKSIYYMIKVFIAIFVNSVRPKIDFNVEYSEE